MHDYEGPLQRLVLSPTLWLVVVWPLAGAAWQGLVAGPRLARARGPDATLRALAAARVAGVGGVVLAATALAGHAWLLARALATSRVLFEPLLPGARLGELDAGVDLLLDLRALVACALSCAVALAASIVLATRPPSERGWRRWAWLQLVLGGALTSFLADGFLVAAMGWTLVAGATAWLTGWRDPDAGRRAATRAAIAVVAMLASGALLFWGLGGAWSADGYDREAAPRLVAVRVAGGGGGPSLTMTGLAGALVYLDEARTASLRAPFVRAPLPPGPHALRVRAMDGAADATVGPLEARASDELTLVPVGPTLSFHAMADQLAVRDAGGRAPFRAALKDRTGPGGLAIVASALLGLLAAAAAVSAAALPLDVPRVLSAVVAGSTAALGPFLLLRLDFLFSSAPHTGAVVASVGAALVLLAVWNALAWVGWRRWLVFAAGAPTGLALVALGLGGAAPALGVLGTTGAASAALYLALAGKDPGPVAARDASLASALLVGIPERLGALLASMERWVVGAVAAAFAATARIAAWVVARVDEHVVASPADRVASGLEGAARLVEPALGVSIGRVAWALLAAAAFAALLHAAWPSF